VKVTNKILYKLLTYFSCGITDIVFMCQSWYIFIVLDDNCIHIEVKILLEYSISCFN
jgi:hypothetical protein